MPGNDSRTAAHASSPDTRTHGHALVSRPGNAEARMALFLDYRVNAELYPKLHEYFRASGVPLPAVWGGNDEIFGPDGTRAFLRDLPDAEVHLLDGGHSLLESHVEAVARYVRGFLGRVL